VKCFFNVAGAIYDPDVDGHEMVDLAEARTMAVHQAAELLRDNPKVIWGGEEFRVEVTDEDRLILFTVIVLGVDAPILARHKRS